jgi:hypothetical protein
MQFNHHYLRRVTEGFSGAVRSVNVYICAQLLFFI